jgi:glutamine synthetase
VERFLALPQNGLVAAEYIWIGGTGQDLRSKTKTLTKVPEKPEDLPIWNFDGSSTGQAPGSNPEGPVIPAHVYAIP